MPGPFLPTSTRIADPSRGYLAPPVWTGFFEFFWKLLRGEPATCTVTWGTGTPEANVTAPVGSLFLRTDGGAGTTLYVKESGVAAVGWRAV